MCEKASLGRGHGRAPEELSCEALGDGGEREGDTGEESRGQLHPAHGKHWRFPRPLLLTYGDADVRNREREGGRKDGHEQDPRLGPRCTCGKYMDGCGLQC